MKPSFDEAIQATPYWPETLWDDMSDKVKEALVKLSTDYTVNLLCSISECESPIEELLGLYLETVHLRSPFAKGGPFIMQAQYEIQTPGGLYRVDFLLHGLFVPFDVYVDLVVECDGHDFHEKTKGQATKDKKRDRDLTAAGYTVVRYTGSEIWKDPLKCAREIRETFISIANRKIGEKFPNPETDEKQTG